MLDCLISSNRFISLVLFQNRHQNLILSEVLIELPLTFWTWEGESNLIYGKLLLSFLLVTIKFPNIIYHSLRAVDDLYTIIY